MKGNEVLRPNASSSSYTVLFQNQPYGHSQWFSQTVPSPSGYSTEETPFRQNKGLPLRAWVVGTEWVGSEELGAVGGGAGACLFPKQGLQVNPHRDTQCKCVCQDGI